MHTTTRDIDARIVVETIDGEKEYPFTLHVSGQVEYGECHDITINNTNRLSDIIQDAEDFIPDLVEEYHINEIERGAA